MATTSYTDSDLRSPFIPEIIDNIMDELRDDDATLKQCSLVSRAFHPPSHRNLFYHIKLNTVERINQLHDLLNSSPNVGRNIRRLTITFEARTRLALHSSLGLIGDIFGMLPGLNVLQLLLGSLGSLEWRELPSQLQAALVSLFNAPSLTTISIEDLHDFPLSVLHSVPVKRLKLSFSSLLKNDRKPTILPQLQLLDIQSHIKDGSAGVEIITPNLRQLLFRHGGQSSELAQQAINTASGSLEHITWDYNLNEADNDISLRSLHCLRFLMFQITYRGVKQWERGFKIISTLKDASISRSLNELTIGFRTYLDNFHDSDWRDVYDSKNWKDLDSVLSSIPTLHRVLIEFEFYNIYDIPQQFWAGMRASMPLLEECGRLALRMR